MRSCVVSVLLFLAAAGAIADVAWEPFALQSYDGRAIAAERAVLVVPENRAAGRASRLIRVAVMRLPGKPGAGAVPIVFLSGGPGVPATAIARVPVYFELFDGLRDIGDVLLIDQRGSGMSVPNLTCPEEDVPANFLESDERFRGALLDRVERCAAYWRRGGLDLRGYSTPEIAADVDAARRAAGAPAMKLLAFSYGSEVAIEILRRWPRSVERVVFASTRAPDTMLKSPAAWDAGLDAVGEKAGVPLRGEVAALVSRLDASPVEARAGEVSLRIGGIGVLWLVRSDLPDGRAVAKLPAMIAGMRRGAYETLATRIAQQSAGFRKSFNLMTLAVDCSSGWSASRLERVQREARSATMRNVNLQWEPAVCAAIHGRSAVPHPPLRSGVPALFITGELDVNAPAAQTDAIRSSFRNSRHVIVGNAAHETLPAPAVQAVVRDFLAGSWPKERRIKLPPIDFIR